MLPHALNSGVRTPVLGAPGKVTRPSRKGGLQNQGCNSSQQGWTRTIRARSDDFSTGSGAHDPRTINLAACRHVFSARKAGDAAKEKERERGRLRKRERGRETQLDMAIRSQRPHTKTRSSCGHMDVSLLGLLH